MIRAALLLPLFALTVAVTPAFAQDKSSADTPEKVSDARIRTVTYSDASVFTIRGKVRVQTTIKFAEDERIQNVAIGDSKAWQVQPNKAQTILFVKPLGINAQTNLTVVTSKRTYLFDLIASSRNAPLYMLQFYHPELERAKEEARLAAEAAAEQERASEEELRAANDPYSVQDPALLNFAWAGAGKGDLLPARAYDDGEALFLTWPAGKAIPAILIANEKGDEGPVNFVVRGDTLVLDEVPSQVILRSGKDVATLTNAGSTFASSSSGGF